MTRHMKPVADPAAALARAMASGPSPDALTRVTGSDAPACLARVHFSDRRPLQLVYGQGDTAALAELHGAECEAEAHRLRISLGKARRGFGAALGEGAVVADPASGLVLRRPGLDARLPGLRLLHQPEAARDLVARILGQDPGALTVTLMAHRLGKRAVLRLAGTDGRIRYARLRTEKSGSGQAAYARHAALWEMLKDDTALRIPEPLGQDDGTCIALFAELPGAAPHFAGCEGFRACRAIGDAVRRLQDLSLTDLPVHDGPAETELLRGWVTRLHGVIPDRASVLAPAVEEVATALSRSAAQVVPCHRDLHEKQILLDGPRAGFLDFDTLCLGHPAMDAGNLMAHLFLMGLTTGRSHVAFETAILNAMSHVPERQLRLWRRAALLRLAMIYAVSDMDAAHQSTLLAEALPPMIEDAALPVLRDLSTEALSRLSGNPDTTLLRLRYRPGKRGILHVSSPAGEGALWTFAGDKGRRIARRNRSSRLDEQTCTVFDPFPNDHRLPEIAALIQSWPVVAPALIETAASGDLHLLRYRPGLSSAFRANGADGRTYFLKVVGDDDVTALAHDNAALVRALDAAPLGVAPTIGTLPTLKTIAYAAAPGQPLDRLLCGSRPERALERTMAALSTLNAVEPVSTRLKDAAALLTVADAARNMVNTIFPALSELTAGVMGRLTSVPTMELCQIHGDMKLEHVFVDRGRVTLIDTETMALGPAAYDRAMLHGRLLMAEQDGLPAATARNIRACIAQGPDPVFDWCRAVVALRLAKFHAQHPGPGAEARAAALLCDLP